MTLKIMIPHQQNLSTCQLYLRAVNPFQGDFFFHYYLLANTGYDHPKFLMRTKMFIAEKNKYQYVKLNGKIFKLMT